MNIQRFLAPTAREALAKARAVFGEGTLILSNRQTPQGVEVVATAEEALASLTAQAEADATPEREAPRKPRNAKPAAAPTPVEADTEQLAMSTLSFQDYVRERMLRRRHETEQTVARRATRAAAEAAQDAQALEAAQAADAAANEPSPAAFQRENRAAVAPKAKAAPAATVATHETPALAAPKAVAATAAHTAPKAAPRAVAQPAPVAPVPTVDFEDIANEIAAQVARDLPQTVADTPLPATTAPLEPRTDDRARRAASQARAAADVAAALAATRPVAPRAVVEPALAEPVAPVVAEPVVAAAVVEPVATVAAVAPAAVVAPVAAPAVVHAAPPLASASPIAVQPAAPEARPQAIVGELQAMKALIDERFNTLAWLGETRQDPIRANLTLKLIRAGFSPVLARALLSHLPDGASPAAAMKWITDTLTRTLRTDTAGHRLLDEGGVFAFVGATGVGKTTTVAKLAGLCAQEHGAASVGLITLDTFRIAAHEQLRAHARQFGVVAHLAHDRAALQELLELFANRHMVLIDTTGVAPQDPRMKGMLDMLDLPGVNRLLVLNAGAHGDTLDSVLSAFKGSGTQHAILSKTDEAVKLGPALDVLIRHQFVLRGVTDGQRVPEDWKSADAGSLVRQSMRAPTRSAFDPRGTADLNFFFAPDSLAAEEALHA